MTETLGGREVGHIEIVEKPGADQPFHVRLVDDGNHARVLWTEDYLDVDGAVGAIEWLGRLMSPVSRATVQRFPNAASFAAGDRHPRFGWLHVWLDGRQLGDKVALPIRLVVQEDNS